VGGRSEHLGGLHTNHSGPSRPVDVFRVALTADRPSNSLSNIASENYGIASLRIHGPPGCSQDCMERWMSDQEAKAAHLKKMAAVAKYIVDPIPSSLPVLLLELYPERTDILGMSAMSVSCHYRRIHCAHSTTSSAQAARGNIRTRFILQAMTWLNQQRWGDHAAVAWPAELAGGDISSEHAVQTFAKLPLVARRPSVRNAWLPRVA
jgi:hypothetical protein